MSSVDINIVYELFTEARALHEPERSRVLEGRCSGNAKLREEVESLLRHADAPATRAEFIETAAIPGGLSPLLAEVGAEQAELPETIGQYRIVRLVGEGGMGSVYEARQQHPERRVALKVLRLGTASRAVLQRFEQEIQLLARLQHVGIAQVYESGWYGQADRPSKGQPFFAMEFVEGVSITEHARMPGCTTRAIVGLVALVADAVEHAHVRWVVHRDLKPANILVTPEGQPKVLDFGVARALERDAHMTSMHTDVGQLIGTLAYMSPEQITGSGGGEGIGAGLDQRTDVYSLGAVLYELLTGRLPHDVRGSSIAHAAARIMNEEPPRMSTLRRELRGDIETIVGKALEKNVERRYQSAAALAADLRRYLNNEPIAARPATTMYQVRKFAQRNRALAAAIAVAIGTLAAGASVSTILAIKEGRLRREAEQSKAAAQRSAYRLALAAADAVSATDPVKALAHLDSAPAALRGWEWAYLRGRLDHVQASAASDRPGDGCEIAVGPRGEPLGAILRGGAVVIIDLATDRIDTTCRGPLTMPRLSDDGSTIAAIEVRSGATTHDAPDASSLPGQPSRAAEQRGPVVVFDSTGHERWRTPVICTDYRISPDGRCVVARTVDRRVQAYRVGDQQPMVDRQLPEGTNYARFTFHHGSECIGVLWDMKENPPAFHAFDSEHGEELAAGLPSDINPFIVALDADRIAMASQRAIRIEDRTTRRLLQTFSGHMNVPVGFILSPDGTRLASAASDRTLRVWDIATGAPLAIIAVDQPITMQRWMPDGAHVIAAHADGRVTLLSTEADSEMVLHHSSFVYHAMFSPDGKYVVSGGWKGEVKLWDASTGRLIATPSEGWLQGAGSPAIVGFARDTGELVVDAANGVFRWNLDALAHGNAAPAVSPPAPQFPETMAKLTSAARRTRVDGGQVTATSADGMLLADAEEGGIVRVLDAAGKTLRTLHPAEGQVRAVSFSPDGAVLAVGGDDRKIYLLGVASGAVQRVLTGHRDTIYTLAFSPDGTRLASGGNDNAIIIWATDMGEPMLELHGHTAYVHAVSFSPDGARLVSASGDGTVRIWGRSAEKRAPH